MREREGSRNEEGLRVKVETQAGGLVATDVSSSGDSEAAASNNSGTPSEEGGGVSESQSKKHRRCSTSSYQCDDKFCR